MSRLRLHLESLLVDRIGWLSATLRVTFWGALAMALTAGIGKVFGMIL
jgi:VIT1/CCC1 family predicted Fe2+/Mn2+ transporter